MTLKIAFVSEKHYPLLNQACEPGVVGSSYADYLMIIDEYRAESKALGIPFEIVRINPDTFAFWCGRRKATWEDLLEYTGSISRIPDPVVNRATAPFHTENRNLSRALQAPI